MKRIRFNLHSLRYVVFSGLLLEVNLTNACIGHRQHHHNLHVACGVCMSSYTTGSLIRHVTSQTPQETRHDISREIKNRERSQENVVWNTPFSQIRNLSLANILVSLYSRGSVQYCVVVCPTCQQFWRKVQGYGRSNLPARLSSVRSPDQDQPDPRHSNPPKWALRQPGLRQRRMPL